MPPGLLQGLAEAILQPIFEVGCYFVGRIVLRAITLGRIVCQTFDDETPSRAELRWGGLAYRRDGRTFMTGEATAFAGLLFLILAGLAAFLIARFGPGRIW